MAANRQTDKQTDIHTHMRNAVTLVWGSLRLAPTNTTNKLSVSVQHKRKTCCTYLVHILCYIQWSQVKSNIFLLYMLITLLRSKHCCAELTL